MLLYNAIYIYITYIIKCEIFLLCVLMLIAARYEYLYVYAYKCVCAHV